MPVGRELVEGSRAETGCNKGWIASAEEESEHDSAREDGAAREDEIASEEEGVVRNFGMRTQIGWRSVNLDIDSSLTHCRKFHRLP